MSFLRSCILLALTFGVFAVGVSQANAGLIGDIVHAEYLLPNLATLDSDAGTKTLVKGTTFTFNDLAAGGNFLSVKFSDTQITLTNLTPGIYPVAAFDGVDLSFLFGPSITGVTTDPSSSPAFAGSVTSFASNDIRVGLSGTCATCSGGESIVLDVATAVPEPASVALLGTGVLGLLWHRRRAA